MFLARSLNVVVKQLVELVNCAIAKVLPMIPKIPVVPNFPRVGFLLLTRLNLNATGLPATDDFESHFIFGGGVDFEILIDTNRLKELKMTEHRRKEYDMQKKVQNTARTWRVESNKNPNAYFS